MPDPQLIAKACAASAVVAAALFFMIAFVPNRIRADATCRRMQVAWPGAISAAFYAGVWVLGLLPPWPPAEDRGRLLLIVLPLTVVIECVAAIARKPCWLGWVLRATLALAVGRILLHDSVYLASETTPTRRAHREIENLILAAETAGSGASSWTFLQSVCILSGIGLSLLIVWLLADRATRRFDSRLIPWVIALTCLAAGVAVMLSGYATSGQLGFPLAAALAGAVSASLLYRDGTEVHGSLGVSLISLFSLLVMGHFFGELATLHVLLLAAVPPVVAIIFLLPLVSRRTWLRAAASLVVTAGTLAVVLVQSGQQFAERSSAAPDSAGDKSEATFEDYMNFRK